MALKLYSLITLTALLLTEGNGAVVWDSTPESVLFICKGQTAQLSWNMTIAKAVLWEIDWFYNTANGSAVVASYKNKHFSPGPSYKGRVTQTHQSGIALTHVTLKDEGNYTINVIVQETSAMVSHNHTITIQVGDGLMLKGDRLEVSQNAVPRWNKATKSWSIQLECGHFTFIGNPPSTVQWILPGNVTSNDTSYENGKFLLFVDMPFVGNGTSYTCRLPPDYFSKTCSNRKLKTFKKPLTATLVFDEIKARLSVTEWELKRLQKQLSGKNLTNCVQWKAVDSFNGVRKIRVQNKKVKVYCDQSTDNGGWLVFQRRKDTEVGFNRGWKDYVKGFGDPQGNFWLGLDNLHKILKSRPHQLRVDLQRWDGTWGSAVYSNFVIDGPAEKYRLGYGSFVGGTAGNSLRQHKGMKFSTGDRDNDREKKKNCARVFGGGWWYNACHESNLNGNYLYYAPNRDGISWNSFNGGYRTYSMKFAEMKIRPMK